MAGMDRRSFLGAAAAAAAGAPVRKDGRPDIVVILADDLGYSDVGCYGGEIETPNIDRLARYGVRFSRFYSAARCCPTRAALLTGLYPHQAGVGHMVEDRGLPGYRGFLNRSSVTLAEVLKTAGYATLMSLARFPATFKCGVAGLIVSDMKMLLTSPAGDIPFSPSAVAFWNQLVGADSPSKYPPELSPVNVADRIKQPVFIYAGAEDIRTPLEQTTAMVRALERAGNPPKKVLIKPEEGHGFGKVENNVDLFQEMLKFLDAAIGPKRGG